MFNNCLSPLPPMPMTTIFFRAFDISRGNVACGLGGLLGGTASSSAHCLVHSRNWYEVSEYGNDDHKMHTQLMVYGK